MVKRVLITLPLVTGKRKIVRLVILAAPRLPKKSITQHSRPSARNA